MSTPLENDRSAHHDPLAERFKDISVEEVLGIHHGILVRTTIEDLIREGLHPDQAYSQAQRIGQVAQVNWDSYDPKAIFEDSIGDYRGRVVIWTASVDVALQGPPIGTVLSDDVLWTAHKWVALETPAIVAIPEGGSELRGSIRVDSANLIKIENLDQQPSRPAVVKDYSDRPFFEFIDSQRNIFCRTVIQELVRDGMEPEQAARIGFIVYETAKNPWEKYNPRNPVDEIRDYRGKVLIVGDPPELKLQSRIATVLGAEKYGTYQLQLETPALGPNVDLHYFIRDSADNLIMIDPPLSPRTDQ